MVCSICGGKLLARGWCRKHYLRWYKYGDPTLVISPSESVPRGPAAANYKHGNWNHPLYGTWNHMLSRCENPNNPTYPRYGGKGIRVCSRWHDIRSFIEDMGGKPKGCYTLDRINSLGDYTPQNCRWATYTTQGRNRPSFVKLNMEKAREIRKLSSGGVKRQIIADEFGVSLATIKKVLLRGPKGYWKE